MKTKELIRQLQEADPEGEKEVCVGNVDIYFVEKKAAYWDGNLQVLQHDPELIGKCWSIVGAKVLEKGYKLNLSCVDIESLVYEDPGVEVDLSDLSEGPRERWEKRVAEWRRTGVAIDEEVLEHSKTNKHERFRRLRDEQ